MRRRIMSQIRIALLTGGGDPHYAYGLTKALLAKGVAVDLIGSDEHDFQEFRTSDAVQYLNLRGSVQPNVAVQKKVFRVFLYYARLIRYTVTAEPKLFHILWNNKFELFDRTLLVLYYRCLGKKIALTAHNVNAGRRDHKDTMLNRITLRIQYGLCHHIFVHTEKMKRELTEDFGVQPHQVTVIPFGINNAVPSTSLSSDEAKQILGLSKDERAILFLGRITPYKGLDCLINAFRQIVFNGGKYRLIIAGRPERCGDYWKTICHAIAEMVQSGHVLLKDSFIPDDEIEVYFKAADVFVLPYRHIYQSGILFLGQSFGTPVIAANVGSFADEIVEGKTGFLFMPENPNNLAHIIERYFASELYEQMDGSRQHIRAHANDAHSWDAVGQITASIYSSVAQKICLGIPSNHDATGDMMEIKERL
jgi:D-inositol-3-phosphate glycosyltransferase